MNRISSADSAHRRSLPGACRFPRVLPSTGGSMFAVTIDLDAYDNLPPRQLKAMLRALRFADEDGVVHASLSMLATPGLSRSRR